MAERGKNEVVDATDIAVFLTLTMDPVDATILRRRVYCTAAVMGAIAALQAVRAVRRRGIRHSIHRGGPEAPMKIASELLDGSWVAWKTGAGLANPSTRGSWLCQAAADAEIHFKQV